MARMGTTLNRNWDRNRDVDFADFGFGHDESLSQWVESSSARDRSPALRSEPQTPLVDVRIAHVLAGTEGVEDVEVSIVCPECETKVLLDVVHEEAMQTAFSLLSTSSGNGKARVPSGAKFRARDTDRKSGERPIADTTWRARATTIREELDMLLTSLPVSDVMSRNTSSLRANARIKSLSTSFGHDDLPGVIVLDDDNRPVGVLTAAQVVRVAFSVSRERFEGMHVRDIMLSKVFCVRSDAPLARAMELFNEQGAGKIAVVGEDGKLAGSLSPAELVKFLER